MLVDRILLVYCRGESGCIRCMTGVDYGTSRLEFGIDTYRYAIIVLIRLYYRNHDLGFK
jgi:hypothetical protein